ncbi:MAG: MMPL family transporter [Proteobacteria bacterium]|nr:MMPL family transporter [Pseudomonadota bacterium]
MRRSLITRAVEFSSRNAWAVIAVSAVLAVVAGVYGARNFRIVSDVNQLISPNLEWRQREIAYREAFPHRGETILVVLDAPTPEAVGAAADRLVARLSDNPALFPSVQILGGGSFFARNALLFPATQDVARTTAGLARLRPFIGALSADPSVRGVMDALSMGVLGVQAGATKLDDLVRPANLLADTLDDALAARPAQFSWRVLLNGHAASTAELRRFIVVAPVLDFNALEPGRAATDAIRKATADLKLAADFGARVRLTGPVPIADEEFSTLKEGADVNAIGTLIAVLIILWIALRSARIIAAVMLSLAVGFAITAALGLLMVGALNLISIAFAVLFVGLGVDFGLQFCVRYRAQLHQLRSPEIALKSTGARVGGPLALAALATAAGFFSFLPTSYRGVAELGLIAGVGMLIAFVSSVTVLPALLSVFKTPGEPHPLGYRWLAPVEKCLERHRYAVVGGTLGLVIIGLPLLYFLRFDFNPLNLRSAQAESVATYLDLRKEPESGGNSAEYLAASIDGAGALARRMAALPEVARVTTPASFVPEAQDEKRALIGAAARALDPVLNPPRRARAPSDAENRRAIAAAADMLRQVVEEQVGPGADAGRRLAGLLRRLAADEAARARAAAAIVGPLEFSLDQLRSMLTPQRVTLATLPSVLRSDWVTPDGRVRVEITPKGDPNDNENLRRFATAVKAVEPGIVGGAITIQDAEKTIVRSFIEAGIFALVSIAILLWVTLRRFTDVLLTLVPLLVAGVVTLEICVLIGFPLNFANIIALPLLLGVGVAFKIYYVIAWRSGKTNLLQSSLTHAVVCSALTTAVAFGSLWLSNHPGTSSMGKLMALSLLCTMAAAVLFQPLLMGPPRTARAVHAPS